MFFIVVINVIGLVIARLQLRPVALSGCLLLRRVFAFDLTAQSL